MAKLIDTECVGDAFLKQPSVIANECGKDPRSRHMHTAKYRMKGIGAVKDDNRCILSGSEAETERYSLLGRG